MSETGSEYTRTEVVKSQPVIDAYVRLMDHGSLHVHYIQCIDSGHLKTVLILSIQSSHIFLAGGKEVRSQFADQDQQTREDMKREKRRIQDQLRRLKRQEEKATKKKQKPQKQKPLTTINVRIV